MFQNEIYTGIFLLIAILSAGAGLVSFFVVQARSTSKKAERVLKIWIGIFYFFVYLTGITSQSEDTFWLWAIFGAMPFIILIIALISGKVIKRNEKLKSFIQGILARKEQ